ncbi:methylated-DNA-protein-cysteine methyltransferase [Thiomicrospira aerophila AL3]|uniref:methylated-DNA--[protein]-cysteine S-methyltransferase n=1 Tax=Thiomicrospira aerophila AL3 TaxID=717772 RepID=W0DTA3_9GAMM|nr:methylated-DNA--[protein]-cysteine S-methyltransferase [Thiomicrospira aerophila]AHF01845.1 methylated-DNA-protein-cysteine methyltransferase [Thiomicrospira aerophila AL3]
MNSRIIPHDWLVSRADTPIGLLYLATWQGRLVRASFAPFDDAADEQALTSQTDHNQTHQAWLDAIHTGVLPGSLAPKGTDFQLSVWQALQQIPLGQTRSYQQLADQLGRPQAVRAVANAIAANPIAWFIPCHRVIRSNGELGGYAWGLAQKQQLLDWEATHAN